MDSLVVTTTAIEGNGPDLTVERGVASRRKRDGATLTRIANDALIYPFPTRWGRRPHILRERREIRKGYLDRSGVSATGTRVLHTNRYLGSHEGNLSLRERRGHRGRGLCIRCATSTPATGTDRKGAVLRGQSPPDGTGKGQKREASAARPPVVKDRHHWVVSQFEMEARTHRMGCGSRRSFDMTRLGAVAKAHPWRPSTDPTERTC
jgi:hypothetical protein